MVDASCSQVDLELEGQAGLLVQLRGISIVSRKNTFGKKDRCLLSWQENLFAFDSPRPAPTPSRDGGSRLLYHGQDISNSSVKDIVRVGVGTSIIGKILSTFSYHFKLLCIVFG